MQPSNLAVRKAVDQFMLHTAAAHCANLWHLCMSRQVTVSFACMWSCKLQTHVKHAANPACCLGPCIWNLMFSCRSYLTAGTQRMASKLVPVHGPRFSNVPFIISTVVKTSGLLCHSNPDLFTLFISPSQRS